MSWLLNKLRGKKNKTEEKIEDYDSSEKSEETKGENLSKGTHYNVKMLNDESVEEIPSEEEQYDSVEEPDGDVIEQPYTQIQMDGVKDNAKGIGSLLGSILSQTRLGTDVLRAGISLPAWLYEPMSLLQRQAEMLEYAFLLDKVAECKDTVDRLAYLAAFAVSGFSSSQRYHNAFNPILGETFEFVDEKNGFKYISEQVSHHPPASATHAEKEKSWVFYQNSSPVTSFLGNAISIDTQGKTHIYFPGNKDHYFYTNPKAKVHNLIFGKMWVEHYGQLHITSLKNGYTCKVNFKKCSFFGGVDYRLDGTICDTDGNICVELEGRWDQYLKGTWLVDTKESEKGKIEELWRVYDYNFINDKYHLSKFAASLIELSDELKSLLPPTDSRLRLDKEKLVSGDIESATKIKKIMEERQRQEKKNRESEWIPTFFHQIPDENGGHMWVYSGDYWEQREKKLEKLKGGVTTGKLLNGGKARGTSSDFCSYEI